MIDYFEDLTAHDLGNLRRRRSWTDIRVRILNSKLSEVLAYQKALDAEFARRGEVPTVSKSNRRVRY